MLNIAYLNYSGGQDSVDAVWNNLLTNLEDLGFRLRHAGAVLEKTPGANEEGPLLLDKNARPYRELSSSLTLQRYDLVRKLDT